MQNIEKLCCGMISRFIPLFIVLASLLFLTNANAESENVIGHWSKLPTPKNMPTSEIFWDWDVSRYPVVDYERGIMYKLINDGGWEFWKYSIQDNTFVKIPVSNFPLSRCCYIYNPDENSIWVTYIGRGATYRLSVAGGESEYIGGSGTYSDNFNSIAYWNSCNKKFSLLFGYGGYYVKNWCWQFGIGDANWNLAQENAAGREPWQRTHSALTVDPSGKRIFVGMGIGNSTGRQYRHDPSFVNNGDYDYLRDLWCLHLEDNTWENLIPLNTIKPLDGKLVYYPDNDALFLFNTLTSKALPGNQVGYEEGAYGEYEEGVWMMRLGKDTNFIKISTKGEAPETNLGANVCYDSINKRILYMNKKEAYAFSVNSTVIQPTITAQPKSQTVNEGNSVTFSVTATGTGLSYQWYKGSSKISGATSASYTIDSAQINDAGNYKVTVSNSNGSVTSSTVTLTVNAVEGRGFLVSYYYPSSWGVSSIASAEACIDDPSASAPEGYPASEWVNVINYSDFHEDSATLLPLEEHFLESKMFPAQQYEWVRYKSYVLLVEGDVMINESGTWSIGVCHDDGFSLSITGNGVDFQSKHNGITPARDTIQSFNFPIKGIYHFRLLHYNNEGSGALELYAAKGSYSSFNSNFRLIGDVTNGGLPVGIVEDIAPVITTQPQSQTIMEGNTVTFSVTVTGTVPLSYQWYKGSSKINGATSASYTISSIKSSDAGSYKVTVSNRAGSVTSSTATLTVNVPVVKPTITVQPKSQTVNVDSSVTFSVTATGMGLSYQWYKGSSKISGATSASYTISSVKTSDAGSYSVTVSNSTGGVTSSTATLTVSVPVVKPTITAQPKSQTVNVGSSVTFSVTATGTGLSYQWYKGSSKISGATSSSYTIGSVKTSDAGSYSVTVSNGAGGETSSVATLTVDVAMVKPTITTQPTSLMVEKGDSATFSVKATGTAPLSYQWYKGVAKINGATSASYTINSAEKSDEASYKVVVSNAAGSVSSSTVILTVNSFSVILSSISISGSSSVNVGGTATYTCTATYNNGATKTVTPIWSISSGETYASITSDGVLTGRASGGATVKASYSDDGVTKTATQAVSITTSKTLVNLSISGSNSVNVGGTATYTCTATYSNGTSKTVTPNWSISSGETYASITSDGVLTGKAVGTVTVKASFSGKTATQNVTINPNSSSTLSSISINGAGSVNVGSTATYTCKATYSDGTTKTVTPNWSISPNTYASITGTGVLTGKAAGTVTVKASYSEGELTKTVTKSVKVKDIMPTITTQPKSQTVNEDTSVTFSVTATGTGLSYQWYKNSTNISGATDASYTISNVKSGDAGSYTVTVSNNTGSVISDVAMLKVNAAVVKPTITTHPKSQTVSEGDSVTFSVAAAGTAPLKYQWKKNGTAISGATSSSYKISSVKSSDEGSYTVTVSNSAGSVTSSTAALTVNPVLMLNSITIFANGTSLTVGRTMSLICKAYYNDGTTKTVMPIWSISSGINYASIDSKGNLIGDATGIVEVQAKYTEGGVTKTATKTMTIVSGVETKPVIITQPKSQTVSECSSVTFSVAATGTGLRYQWYKDSTKINGATKADYTINSVENSDAGSYTVTVSNSAGSVTSSVVTLKVNPVSSPIKISKENYGTKVTITFTGTLQESSDMKTWKDVTDQSPYTTSVWRGKKFYRSVK